MIDKFEMTQEINNLIELNFPIITEGKRDIIALKKIGFENIIEIKGSIFELCENISKKYDEIVILTDFDFEGNKLYNNLKENLERLGVKINNDFRIILKTKTRLSHIEGIDSYLENLDYSKRD